MKLALVGLPYYFVEWQRRLGSLTALVAMHDVGVVVVVVVTLSILSTNIDIDP